MFFTFCVSKNLIVIAYKVCLHDLALFIAAFAVQLCGYSVFRVSYFLFITQASKNDLTRE
jgi:hypothetical protein